MDPEEMKKRTKQFGLRVIHLVDTLPHTGIADIIGRQILRCSTSVGANYRAACRAQSRRDFIAKAFDAVEEADETLYWLEILVESNLIKGERVASLIGEANEIVAILTASVKTARENLVRK